MRIAIIGASGKSGAFLATRALASGHEVVALSRDRERLTALPAGVVRRSADLDDAAGTRAALTGADAVVNLAHARFTAQLLAALPDSCRRIVAVGSVRRYSELPDPAADAVRAGEAALAAWRASPAALGRTAVMLHASMVYGAPADRNVGRLLRFVRRYPRWLPVLVPLPSAGRATVQPVFVEDFVAALLAAAERPDTRAATIDVVGPEAISYAEFVRSCAAALGRTAHIVPVGTAVLLFAAGALGAIGVRVPFNAAELRRGAESKRFSPEPMRTELGVSPRPFAVGVAEKVARGWF